LLAQWEGGNRTTHPILLISHIKSFK
jgi:hypothetical protein